MSDEELIDFLRSDCADTVSPEAADRIEELVREAAETHKTTMSRIKKWGAALNGQREAESKLAEAVAALRKLITCVDDGCYCSEMQMASTMDEARAVLAELEKTE